MLIVSIILLLLIFISMSIHFWQGRHLRRQVLHAAEHTAQLVALEHDIAHATALVHLVMHHQVPIVWDQLQQIRLQPLPTTTNDQLTGLCRDLAGMCPSPTVVVVDVTDLPRSVRLPLAQHLITQLQTHGYQSLRVHGLDAVIPPILHATTHTRN